MVRKFVSIFREKWDPGCVTALKPTGYPTVSAARTKTWAGFTIMAYGGRTEVMASFTHPWMRTSHSDISSPGVGRGHVNTAHEKPDTTRYARVAEDVAPVNELRNQGSQGDPLTNRTHRWGRALPFGPT